MFRLWLMGAVLIGGGLGRGLAQPRSRITTVYDFVSHFDRDRVVNAQEATVTVAASGGVRKRSLFEHPRDENEALISFDVPLPPEAGDGLWFVFSLGLRDGVKFDDPAHPADGVRYAVEVEGERLFQTVHAETRWQPYALDLTPYAGRRVRVVLLTHPNGTSNYDWALWGEPRLLRVEGNLLAGPSPQGVTCSVGLVSFRYRAGTEAQVRIEPQGNEGKPVVWSPPPTAPSSQEWQPGAVEFDFPAAAAVTITWTGNLRTVAAYAYQPELQVVRLAPAAALVQVGESFRVRATVQNGGRAPLRAPGATVRLTGSGQRLPPRQVETLAPAAETTVEWSLPAQTEPPALTLTVEGPQVEPVTAKRTVRLVPPLPALPPGVPHKPQAYLRGNAAVLENSCLRLAFVKGSEGYEYAAVFVAEGETWQPVGALTPLAQLTYLSEAGETCSEAVRPQAAPVVRRRGEYAGLKFSHRLTDADGATWWVTAEFRVKTQAEQVALNYTLQANAPRSLLAFVGPRLYAGEGAFGARKTFALFPGLEYLREDEPSSSTRDAKPPLHLRLMPHPYKITVPLMAVSFALRPSPLVVALLWDPLQKWDGEHIAPSALFASPNWYEKQDNHLLALFLPRGPDFVPENQPQATAQTAYPLAAGRELTLQAHLLATLGDVTTALRQWYDTYAGGVPPPAEPPRDFAAELALCRHGFLHTVWDEETQKWRHCVGWAPHHTPGFATLLWYDWHLSSPRLRGAKEVDEAARREVKERLALVTRNILQDQGPEGLASTANCHLMRWEYPFYVGHLLGGLRGAEKMVRSILRGQQPDGSWRFQPDERRRVLGTPGDAVLGTCAHPAFLLLKYARLTGDEECLTAGLKALKFMQRFRIPRGAQGWECPIYEPDILAAAWAVGAYVEGYRVTGDLRWLEQAVYWAETGLPFLYAWNLPDRPAQRYAALPVFGTTFYTHSWFGVPVQWCGLVYAYEVQHLAACLEEVEPGTPLLRRFSAADWRRVAEGVTVSAMHQQFAEGELKGTYPDGFYDHFTRRAAPYLNPEDIMANLLALHGYDPDISSVILRLRGRRLHISSGARVSGVRIEDHALRFRLHTFPQAESYLLLTGLPQPSRITVDGRELARVEEVDSVAEGWQWEAAHGWAAVKIRPGPADRNVTVFAELGS